MPTETQPRFEEIKSIVVNGIEYIPTHEKTILVRIGVGNLIEVVSGKHESLTLREKHPAV